MVDGTVKILEEVAQERHLQVEVAGHGYDRDDCYVNQELAAAVAAYLLDSNQTWRPDGGINVPAIWPWPAARYRAVDYRRKLIMAITLAVAEVERHDRMMKTAESVSFVNSADTDPFVCPNCGSKKGTWFDRSFTVHPDGTEDDMATRCIECGIDISEDDRGAI